MNISDDLLTEAKRIAALSGRSLGQVIDDALRASLARGRRQQESDFSMPTFGGGGTLPGVDLDDSAGLLDLMDDTDMSDRR